LGRALARLDELVDWEKRDRSPGMRRGLDPVRDLVARLGSPERSFRAVHVAGSKGKGTTAALIAAGLSRAGFRTGLYTSPHVDRVEERVRIDGEDVDAGELAEALERALAAREQALVEKTPADEATWFDLLTAAAFCVFRARGVDWAVIECGLGGRLDSTNVVFGEVCVVTNIELEHTAVLGNSLTAIAREKGGIVKPGARFVTGVTPGPADDDPNAVLEEVAREVGVALVRAPVTLRMTSPGASHGRQPSAHERNLSLAWTVLNELGLAGVAGEDARPLSADLLDDETVAGARLPGRMERRQAGSVPIVIDGAHVPASVTLALESVRGDSELSGPPVVLLALGRDKDEGGVLKALRAHVDTVVCTTVTSGPLRPAEELCAAARAMGFDAEALAEPGPAFERALERAANGWLLVIGSFYLAGAVRAALRTGSGDRTT
jgi:dihydrofolate synthase/folylpolyglutamate synthase